MDHSAAGRILSRCNHDIYACSAVPKPAAPPRALVEKTVNIIFLTTWKKVDKTWWKVNWSLGVLVRQTFSDDDHDVDDDDDDVVVMMLRW
jgi:hypothetical protein